MKIKFYYALLLLVMITYQPATSSKEWTRWDHAKHFFGRWKDYLYGKYILSNALIYRFNYVKAQEGRMQAEWFNGKAISNDKRIIVPDTQTLQQRLEPKFSDFVEKTSFIQNMAERKFHQQEIDLQVEWALCEYATKVDYETYQSMRANKDHLFALITGQ